MLLNSQSLSLSVIFDRALIHFKLVVHVDLILGLLQLLSFLGFEELRLDGQLFSLFHDLRLLK